MKQRNKRSGKKVRYDEVTRVYNSFAVKDMTLGEFRYAYNAEISPRNMKKELKELVRYRSHQRTQRAVAARQKQAIDQRVSEN